MLTVSSNNSRQLACLEGAGRQRQQLADSRLVAAITACLTKAALQLRDEGFDLMFSQIQWISM